MRRRREDLTPDVRQQVVKDYLAGAKTMVIQWEHKISPGEMYRILHRKGVSLRKGKVAEPPPFRPKCRRCGRDYDPGLRKDGQPLRNEPRCWICSGWATDCRGPREVYNQDGSKVMSKLDDPWALGKPIPRKE